MTRFAIVLIKLYQKTLSPDHGWFKVRYPYGFCKFYPSCSQYAIESLKQYGLLKGSVYSIIRIIKCNPFSSPKIDKIKI